MERLRPPDSVFILLASITHLMAMLITSFLRWYGFVVENLDVINDTQLDLFCHHLTHTLTFVSLLWCLFLGVIRMCLPQDLLVGTRLLGLSALPYFAQGGCRGGEAVSLGLSALPYSPWRSSRDVLSGVRSLSALPYWPQAAAGVHSFPGPVSYPIRFYHDSNQIFRA